MESERKKKMENTSVGSLVYMHEMVRDMCIAPDLICKSVFWRFSYK